MPAPRYHQRVLGRGEGRPLRRALQPTTRAGRRAVTWLRLAKQVLLLAWALLPFPPP